MILTSVNPGVIVGAAMKTTNGANSAVLRTFNACVRNKDGDFKKKQTHAALK